MSSTDIILKKLSSKWMQLCIHLLFFTCCIAQHNNNWAFGAKSGLSFITNPPSLITTSIGQDTTGGYTNTSSSYSDCNGNLIVYGHRSQLWNKNHKPMFNGKFGLGGSNYQFSPIIPKPNSNRYLYFFYKDYYSTNNNYNSKLFYAIIDMSLDNGLGGVIMKDKLLDSSDAGAISNNITYTIHENKRDIWLIYATSSKIVKSFLLTDTGIIHQPVVSNNIFSFDRSEAWYGGPAYTSVYASEGNDFLLGHFKMTHDGKKLIVSGIDSSTTKAGPCLMYDFDNSTGVLSNQQSLLQFSDVNPTSITYFKGNFFYCEIAPNDSIFYFSNTINYALPPLYSPEYRTVIIQVNRFTLTKTIAKTIQGGINSSLQIGPDGKIYTISRIYRNGTTLSTNISCINKPNLIGSLCDYKNIITGNSNQLTYNFPYVYQPYYKLYFTSNLQTNPCVDTAYFDVHVDDFFREFKVYYGDGDSLVLYPPFQKAYHFKHIYKNTGKYYFKAMGLNPNCDYYTTVGDSILVARQPTRLFSNSFIEKNCNSSVLHIHDSFFNTQKAIYSYPLFSNDTFIVSDTLLSAKAIKSYSKNDSIKSLVVSVQVSNSSCPYPSKYIDTFSIGFLPEHSIRFTVNSSNLKIDSLNGKLHFSGCSPLLLRFVDSSLNLRNGSINWNSKSTHYSNAVEIAETFDKGFYTAIINDTNTSGCINSDTFYITSFHSPQNTWLSNSLNQCYKGNSISLGSTFDTLNSTLSKLYWGDGDSTILDSGILYQHRYNQAGNYKAQIISKTNTNCINIIDTTITIYPEVNADFSINKNIQCYKGNSYLFTRLDTTFASNEWNWGDANPDTVIHTISAQHSYLNIGIYSVRNITISVHNCKDTAVYIVQVLESPISNFDVTDTIQCITNNSFEVNTNTQHSLIDSITHTIQWGDLESVSFLGNKTHKHNYKQNGTFRIKLMSVLGNCSDSASKLIQIIAKPSIKLSANYFCLGDSTRIQVQSNTKDLVYRWKFDSEDKVSTDSILSHVFPSIGQFPISVKSNGYICSTSDSINIYIIQKPIAAFDAIHFNEHTNGVKFQFISKSIGANTWNWEFGNLDQSILESPEYIYNDTGYYKVQLIVSNQNKCFDTTFQLIPVFNSFEFFFPNAVTPNANGINDGFGLNLLQKNFVKEYEVAIFNRWGEKIFYSNDIHEVWNPSSVQQSVYVYTIQIRDIYNVLHEIKGVVEVLR